MSRSAASPGRPLRAWCRGEPGRWRSGRCHGRHPGECARSMNGPTLTATSWARPGVKGSGSRTAASIALNASTTVWLLGAEGAGRVAAAAEETLHRVASCVELGWAAWLAGVLSARGKWTWRCSTSTSRPRSRSVRARISVRPLALFRTKSRRPESEGHGAELHVPSRP